MFAYSYIILTTCLSRIRAGIAFAVSAPGVLFGTPVVGALLGEVFPWWRAIVFSAVRYDLLLFDEFTYVLFTQALVATSVVLYFIARIYIARRKNSAIV